MSWNSSSIPIVNFSAMGLTARIVPACTRRARGSGRGGRAALAALAVLSCAAPAAPGEGSSAPRGPIELRDEWLLCQMRLTLPALAPDTLPSGRSRLRLTFDWGNDFGWSQDVRGETPVDRRFLVDGEHRTLALELTHGWGRGLETGVRLPLRWRGPGVMDGLIDAFHDVTARLGIPDNGRPSFLTDRFRVLGRDSEGRPVDWEADPGTGLGNVELDLKWAPARAGSLQRGLVARVALPTGTSPFQSDGLEAGLQLAASAPLAGPLDLYFGVGGTAFSDVELAGIEYARLRGFGFLVVEWRAGDAWSLLAQVDGSSRLVTNLARYPAYQSYLKIGVKWDLRPRLRVEAGIAENLARQQGTTDFGLFLGLTRSY
jgi:hypothetical protein